MGVVAAIAFNPSHILPSLPYGPVFIPVSFDNETLRI
jgi:hypothetical protein